MSRTLLSVLAVLVLVVSAGTVLAQDDAVEVTYNGVLVCRYRSVCGEMTPEQRAVATEQALVEAISAIYATEDEVFHPECVTVKSARCKQCGYSAKQIVMGKIVIATICKADAKANACCTQQLAARWLKLIRTALTVATHDC